MPFHHVLTIIKNTIHLERFNILPKVVNCFLEYCSPFLMDRMTSTPATPEIRWRQHRQYLQK
jgi:hypothetical protein